MPSPNYFLANSNTGLFAKCHSDCNTCSKKYTNLTTNCDTCANSELYLLDGNCIFTCPEGYYPTIAIGINVCNKCYKNCLNCTQGEIYLGSVLSDMNCLKCKKGKDPKDSNNIIENQIQIDKNCFPIIAYTEKKITFNTSDMSSGEIEKSCLDYGKAIITGEYECIEKPTNYYYVSTNNNTGVIELCDVTCSTCTWGKNNLINDTNCINCSEGYFKTQDSNTNCILGSLIPENYLKNNSDNIYYKCHSNCQKCNGYYDLAENDMHCTQCLKDFYFVNGMNNCYNMSFVEENNYYLSEGDNKFYQCYFLCLRCSQPELNEYNHNCDKCISGFYLEYGTKNCYNDSILERGYYLDNFTISTREDPSYKKCYENCKTCNNTIINYNMNCISCKDNLYKINGTNNCYDETLKEQGYYLKENIFYPCEDNCKTCNDSKTDINGIISNNCLSCDYSTKGLYLVPDFKNCEPESFKEKGYYLAPESDNSEIKIFYKCYFSCALCDNDKKKESSNHNCLTCREIFYPKKDDINPKNCYNETEMIPKGYTLINNSWTILNENSTGNNISNKTKNNTNNTGNSFIDNIGNNIPILIHNTSIITNQIIDDIIINLIGFSNFQNLYEYYCQFEAKIEDKKTVVKIVDIDQFNFSLINTTFNNYYVIASPLAKIFKDNLQKIPKEFDALKNSTTYILEHSKVKINKTPYFNLFGIIEQKPNLPKNIFKIMTISNSDNGTLSSKINCTLINITKNNYIFNCIGKKGEQYNLENSLSFNEDKILILNFDSSNNSNFNFEALGKINNRINFSKEGNLSAGAIVAIVLALVIAIGSFIIFLICLRRNKFEEDKELPSSGINLKTII